MVILSGPFGSIPIYISYLRKITYIQGGDRIDLFYYAKLVGPDLENSGITLKQLEIRRFTCLRVLKRCIEHIAIKTGFA